MLDVWKKKNLNTLADERKEKKIAQRSWSNGVMRKTMSIRMDAVGIAQRFFFGAARMFTK